MSRFRSFVTELRRRRVFRAAATYLIVAWLLVQVAATTFPLLGLPEWMARAVLIVLLLGFPVAMVVAWAFDLGAGLQLTPDAGPDAAAAPPRYGRLPVVAVIALLVGAGIGAFFALGGLQSPHAAGKSIAVLPFQNLSGRAEDAYLADGLQEEILNALARLRDLKVISRSSVMEYRDRTRNVREIGARLDVATVLEGSVRRDGDKLRLTVQLIDTRNDNHLLAANYDRSVDHVFELQSAVARQVADALAATLSRHERGELERVATNNGDAYDRYLRAVAAFRRPAPGDEDGLIAPRKMLDEALGFDADYADALALLSRVETWTWFLGERSEERAVAARRAFERALAIDPALPEAILARGLYSMYIARDADRALEDFEAVLAQRPNDAEVHSLMGFALRRMGRFDDALVHLKAASSLDPLNELGSMAPVITLLALRRFPEAEEQVRLVIQRFPERADGYLVQARLQSFMQKSLEPFRTALRKHDNLLSADDRGAYTAEIAQYEGRYRDAIDAWERVSTNDPFARNLRLGSLYDAAGAADRAREHYSAAIAYADSIGRDPARVQPESIALAQSLQGNNVDALAIIEQAHLDLPESMDPINGPRISFFRSVVLVRAGRVREGHAELARLLRVPFGAPFERFLYPAEFELRWAVRGDRAFDEIFDAPPRL